MRSSKVLTNTLLSFTLIYILVFILAQLKFYVDNGGDRPER